MAEDNFTGHRWNYIEYLMDGAEQLGIDLRLATTEEALPSLKDVAGDRLEALPLEILPAFTLDQLGRRADEVGARQVTITDADRLALRIGLGKRWPSSATLCLLIMRQEAQPRPSELQRKAIDLTRRALFAAASRRPRITLRFLASGLALTDDPKFTLDPVTFTPDPEPPLELDPRIFWFGLLGALDERKNVPLVLDAIKVLDMPNVGLVLAGRQAPEVVASLEGVEDRYPFPVLQLDARLSEGGLDSLVRDVDCVVIAYSNSAPSGLVAKAAVAGTRVVASRSRTFAADVARIGSGAVMTDLTLEGLTGALRTVTEQPRPTPIQLGTESFVESLLV